MQVLHVGDRLITGEEVLTLLAGYQMLPQLYRQLAIDSAIAALELLPEEQELALQQFYAKYQLPTTAERQAYLQHYGMTGEQLYALAMRERKIEKFKQTTWSEKLAAYFLTHKSKLDRVIYSILRHTDPLVAQEMYFRIQSGEQTFSECASQYSQGIEAETGGIIGPVELSTPHPILAQLLSNAQPGQLLPPTRLAQWYIVVRLEKFIPAQLDEAMRQKLLDKLFEAWLTEQIKACKIG